MWAMQGDDSDMDADLRIEEQIAREEDEHREREQGEASPVDESDVEFLGKDTPHIETGALSTIQAMVDHKAALTNEARAKTASADALEAKNTACEKKKRAYDAKEVAFSSPALTAVWKTAIQDEKKATAACKHAKGAVLQATEA